MKKILLTTLLSFSYLTYSQIMNINALDYNNSISYNSDLGFLHCAPLSLDVGYKIDKTSAQGIISTSSFWFGGIGDNAEINLCAQTYLGTHDLKQGPYSSKDSTSIDYYISLWTVSQIEIDDHISNYNTIGYVTPTNISKWPAHGDTSLGFSYNLAPFVDVDNNGKYEPMQGDYPAIKGCKTTYIITNDATIHNSGGKKLGIEIHYLIYQIGSNTPYDDVTFMDINIYKRTSETINDFTMTYFVDGDIGNSTDDYVGSNPERNTMFFYNADNDDQTAIIPGYGINPPAFGVVCLNGNVESVGYYKYGNQDPNTPIHYWNYMNAKDKAGNPWTDSIGIPTTYMFPGNPNNPNEYSAYSEALEPNDYRGIMSVKAGTLSQGDVVSKTYAIVPATTGSNHLDQVNVLFDRVDALQADFNNNTISCGYTLSVSENTTPRENLVLYPNPSNSKINFKGLENGLTKISIVDILGKVHLETSISNSETSINIERFPKGIYLIQVISENGKGSTLKMIKE